MSRNVEIKARVGDPAALEQRVRALADSGPVEIFQDDSFFNTPRGRLKLRDFGDGSGELIYYERGDQAGPKTSFYEITATAEAEQLRRVLTLACGETGRVRKQRYLYLAGRTRIHLDRVEGLGDFMELEVVLSADELPQQGQREAEQLMKRLGVEADSLIECAYVDLVAPSSTHRKQPTR
ncbi:MAG: CYTH domain-containing protein [Wenzhouxiangella sp.]|nr:MAG: CYTH domain-containing protein [Wenzhouxiangella sp.]